MRPIDPKEVLGLADYEEVRERFRARVIGEKKLRRVPLGPKATVVFENRDTVLLQIQEMLRTERITRPAAVQHELDTYNELLPGPDELSATLMIEIPDRAEREAFLEAANGFERHVWLVAGGQRVGARAIDRTGGEAAARTTAVHYLKFSLPKDVSAALGAPGDVELALEVDHPAYRVRTALPRAAIASLREDLAG